MDVDGEMRSQKSIFASLTPEEWSEAASMAAGSLRSSNSTCTPPNDDIVEASRVLEQCRTSHSSQDSTLQTQSSRDSTKHGSSTENGLLPLKSELQSTGESIPREVDVLPVSVLPLREFDEVNCKRNQSEQGMVREQPQKNRQDCPRSGQLQYLDESHVVEMPVGLHAHERCTAGSEKSRAAQGTSNRELNTTKGSEESPTVQNLENFLAFAQVPPPNDISQARWRSRRPSSGIFAAPQTTKLVENDTLHFSSQSSEFSQDLSQNTLSPSLSNPWSGPIQHIQALSPFQSLPPDVKPMLSLFWGITRNTHENVCTMYAVHGNHLVQEDMQMVGEADCSDFGFRDESMFLDSEPSSLLESDPADEKIPPGYMPLSSLRDILGATFVREIIALEDPPLGSDDSESSDCGYDENEEHEDLQLREAVKSDEQESKRKETDEYKQKGERRVEHENEALITQYENRGIEETPESTPIQSFGNGGAPGAEPKRNQQSLQTSKKNDKHHGGNYSESPSLAKEKNTEIIRRLELPEADTQQNPKECALSEKVARNDAEATSLRGEKQHQSSQTESQCRVISNELRTSTFAPMSQDHPRLSVEDQDEQLEARLGAESLIRIRVKMDSKRMRQDELASRSTGPNFPPKTQRPVLDGGSQELSAGETTGEAVEESTETQSVSEDRAGNEHATEEIEKRSNLTESTFSASKAKVVYKQGMIVAYLPVGPDPAVVNAEAFLHLEVDVQARKEIVCGPATERGERGCKRHSRAGSAIVGARDRHSCKRRRYSTQNSCEMGRHSYHTSEHPVQSLVSTFADGNSVYYYTDQSCLIPIETAVFLCVYSDGDQEHLPYLTLRELGLESKTMSIKFDENYCPNSHQSV